jgi:hypothetical protein
VISYLQPRWYTAGTEAHGVRHIVDLSRETLEERIEKLEKVTEIPAKGFLQNLVQHLRQSSNERADDGHVVRGQRHEIVVVLRESFLPLHCFQLLYSLDDILPIFFRLHPGCDRLLQTLKEFSRRLVDDVDRMISTVNGRRSHVLQGPVAICSGNRKLEVESI